DVAARAGTVLDDKLLLERFTQGLREQAGVDVGATARRGRHDEPHGLRRPGVVLRCSRQSAAGKQDQGKGTAQRPGHYAAHVLPPFFMRSRARFFQRSHGLATTERITASASSDSSPSRYVISPPRPMASACSRALSSV